MMAQTPLETMKRQTPIETMKRKETTIETMKRQEEAIKLQAEPIKPKEGPINSKEGPINSKEGPINSKEEPIDPKEEPIKPKEESIKLKEEPIKPKEELIKPKEEPIKPKEEPTKPQEVSTKPQEEPTKPQEESTKPQEEPIKPQETTKDKSIEKEMKQTIKEPYKLIFQLAFLVFIKSFFYILLTIFKRLNPYKRKEVKDKLVAITGAGKGLGKQLAIDFVKLGSKVACIDSDNKANENTADVINRIFPYHARIYNGDVTKEVELKKIWDDIVYENEHLDILIVTDSISIEGNTVPDTTYDQLQSALYTNFIGPFQVIRQFLSSIEPKSELQIVIVSSSVGLSSVENGGLYMALEGARIGLAEGIYNDFRKLRNNIKITTICPYFIHYGKRESSALDLRIGPLPLQEASQSIIDGIREERRICTVPRYLYYWYTLQKLFPDKLKDAFNDILYKKFVNQSSAAKITT